MKKNVLVVVNPVSGTIDKSEFIEAILLFAKKENRNCILYTTTGKDDILHIKTLKNLHKPEKIIVVGGDGTIKMVADAIEDQDVILGILPAGSANGLAVELDLIRSLQENVEIAFHNHFIEMDMVDINGKKSMHLSDLGLNASLIKNYKESDIRGMWGYVLQSITTLIELNEPFTAMIQANNQILECKARMIIIANSKKYGTGVVINPDGVIDDGKFELVIIKNLDILLFVEIIAGNITMNSEDVTIISTDKATINTNFPVSFQMDGEYCGEQTKLDIKILSKQIKIAIP